MAKYKLVAANIPALKEKGIVTAGDEMTINVAHRAQGEKNKRFVLTFDVVNEAVETDNRLAMVSIESMRLSPIKTDGSYRLLTPDTALFEKLADGDPTPSKVLHTDGEETLTNHEKKLVRSYLKAKINDGDPQTHPASWKRSDAATHLTSAKAYIASQS